MWRLSMPYFFAFKLWGGNFQSESHSENKNKTVRSFIGSLQLKIHTYLCFANCNMSTVNLLFFMYSMCWHCLHSIHCWTKESEMYTIYKHRKLMCALYSLSCCTILQLLLFWFKIHFIYTCMKDRLSSCGIILFERQDTEKEERVGEKYTAKLSMLLYYTLFVNCSFDSIYYTSMFMLSANFC